jgi:hypothetical protein
MAGKYVGFDKLKGELAQRPGVTDPGALAAAIGRKKYGKKRFQKHAANGSDLRSRRRAIPSGRRSSFVDMVVCIPRIVAEILSPV